ncbi:MAG TPA: threonine ammonia-lyase, biosynthetic [Agitococcus sp.]|nr:threonine ammonia-lyase, biosynthetic [Agitococcus sp.]HMV59890.1 threonine ammonia-lyase, biosynthetic [Agitococcus sp.]HMX99697.1 threonine ammonia-lyase, biosynthetic [Agitococcus sp.]HMY28512.1 threonine ammonia-lyase, biosynthetic [Agitococcus sp.]HNA20292.1 threonine ammonia-lyase, biosynthetic [Agitococcus sp.]
MIRLEDYVRRTLQAKVYDIAKETPLDEMRYLSRRLKNKILLKREDLQPVFSFKIRGAYNKIASLSQEDRAKGVICASAGNHAQGVALSASKLGIKGIIVMPQTTPDIKVNAVKSFGGHVVLHGDAFDEAAAYAKQLAADKGYSFIHPYDDLEVIAGQGTVAMEILRQQTQGIDAVFIPVGGGGLMAGMAAYIKYVRPDIKVIAVEPEDAACLKVAMDAQERVVLSQVGLFADGVAVAQIGEQTFKVAQHCVDEVITCNTDEICAAIKDIFEDTRSIAEPAGALSLAGLKKYCQREQCEQQTLIAIDSGANMNFDRLRHISERTEIGEKREAIFAVTIPEKAGSFKTFCQMLGKRNLTEFNYRYADNKEAYVFVGIQLRAGTQERLELKENLEKKGYAVLDLSDDEMAKLHIRHLVGGHAGLADEHLFRFEFPERPGALLNFLSRLSGHNISLFHYRNHGAAYGRVLIGLQLGKKSKEDLLASLQAVGYPFSEESSNPAYQLFLR